MSDSGWDGAAHDLYARFHAGAVSPAEMVAQLPCVWRFRSRKDPLGDAAWRAMIEHAGRAGYFTWRIGQPNGRLTRRPLWSRRLFRGAAPDRRFGMSWTKDRAIAEHFADSRQPSEEVGQVWVARFAPSRLLAYLGDEKEYLVDTTDTDIQPWHPRWG